MACSCSALIALVMTLAALISAILAFAVPLWLHNDTDLSLNTPFFQGQGHVQYGVGVWGICMELTSNAPVQQLKDMTQCLMFYTDSSITTLLEDQFNANLKGVDYALCDYYQNEADLFGQVDTIANTLGIDIPPEFLERTCGTLGKFTLAFSVLSFCAGTIMLLVLILGIMCCKKKSRFVSFAGILGYTTGIFCTVTWILWISQSSQLRDTTNSSYAASFYLSIVGMLLFFCAGFLSHRHVRSGKQQELQRAANVYHAAPATQKASGGQPMTAQPIVGGGQQPIV